MIGKDEEPLLQNLSYTIYKFSLDIVRVSKFVQLSQSVHVLQELKSTHYLHKWTLLIWIIIKCLYRNFWFCWKYNHLQINIPFEHHRPRKGLAKETISCAPKILIMLTSYNVVHAKKILIWSHHKIVRVFFPLYNHVRVRAIIFRNT